MKGPLGDRVVIEPGKAEEVTKGGIIIPDTAKETPRQGLVIEAGPGDRDKPMSIKAGDKVLYGQYAGTEVKIDGKEYLIMRESDIFYIL